MHSPMKAFRVLIVAMSLLGLLSAARPARAAWKEPADKKMSEDQFKRYLETATDYLKETAKIQQEVANARTQAERIAAVQGMDKRLQAVLDGHKMEKPEFDWLANRSVEAYGAAVMLDTLAQSQARADDQAKQLDTKMADAQKQLDLYTAAQKDGKRVMTPEDRESAIKSARENQQSALDDVKQHDDEIKTAQAEIKQHQDEASAADALAAKPPADVSADDRADYVQGKKNEAQAAREALKESQGRLADAQKAQAEAIAKAKTYGDKAARPEIPVTDDEKAQVKSENDNAIKSAQTDVDQARQAKVYLAQAESQIKLTLDQSANTAPPENVAILRKHKAEYEAALKGAFGVGIVPPAGKS